MVIFDKISTCDNISLVKNFINRYYEITNLNENAGIDPFSKKYLAKTIDDIFSGSSDYLTRNNYKTPYNKDSLQELSNIIRSQTTHKFFYSNKKLINAVQEVHNRFATRLGTPAVCVHKQNSNEYIMGLEKAYNFNRNQIFDKENVKIIYSTKNKISVSIFSILHETKHSQQNYSLYKLVNGAKLNTAEKVSAYICLHTTYSDLDNLLKFPGFSVKDIYREKVSYAHDFGEVDANIYAINTLEKLAEKGLIKLTPVEFFQINMEKFNIIKNFKYKRTVKGNKFFEDVKEKMQLTIKRIIQDVNSLNNCSISKKSLEDITLQTNTLLKEAKNELDENDYNFFKKNVVTDLFSQKENKEKINKSSIFIAKELNDLSFDSYFDFLEKTVFQYYTDLQTVITDFEKKYNIYTNAFSGGELILSHDDFEFIIFDTFTQKRLSEANEPILTK